MDTQTTKISKYPHLNKKRTHFNPWVCHLSIAGLHMTCTVLFRHVLFPQVPVDRDQSRDPRLALCPRKPGKEAGPALPLRAHNSGEQEQGRARKPGCRWHLCLPLSASAFPGPSASPPAHVPRSDCLLSSLQALTSQSLYRQAGPAQVTACLLLPAPVSSLDLQVSNFSPFPLPPPPSPRPECLTQSSSVWGLCGGRGGLFGGEKPDSGCG